MTTSDDAEPTGPPQPDPALRRLDPLLGTWTMTGRYVGEDEDTITGRATFQWLEGGFFLQQDTAIDFASGLSVRSRELIGHDPETGAFASLVFSNLSPVALPYRWDLRDGRLTISVSYGPLDATFEGRFGADGDMFAGGWRPNPGADETINIPYDVDATRVT